MIKKISILAIISILIISCKKEIKQVPNSIEALRFEKIKLEKYKDSIDEILVKIDNKIKALDTLKKLQIVTVLPIKLTEFNHYISIQGNTATDKNVIVKPMASGIITKVYVNEGQSVVSGQTLMQLDDAILKNSISEIENQLLLAKTTFERQKRLWNQKIGSEMQFLQAKTNKESLEKKINTLQSQLKNYKIKAPFSGVIEDIIAKKGDLASPQTPALRIINLHKMYIESDVSEDYLKSIKKGNSVSINFPSLGEKIETKISQVGNYINPANRSFKIRINIPNKRGIIKPNLLADVKIKDYQNKNAIVIPSNLIQIDENGKTFVFTITKKENKSFVTKKIIEIDKEYNGNSHIKKGLTDTDILINEGSRNVSENQEVTTL